MSQAAKNIKTKLNKFVAGCKAYSGYIFYPLVLPERKRKLGRIAIEVAQFATEGWILDIGTGPGYLPLEIVKNCPNVRVVGTDIALDLIIDEIKNARNKHLAERVSVVGAKAESLPFINNIFDMILSTYSLHLWKNKQYGIKEIYRVLKPGAKAILLVGTAMFLLSYISDLFNREPIASIRTYCLNAGFKADRIKIKIEDECAVLRIIVTK